MSSEGAVAHGTGIGLSGAFLVLFVGLKLAGCIGWSWVWVLSPIWIPFIMLTAAITLFTMFALVLAIREG